MDIRHAVGVKAGIPAKKLSALASYKESWHFTGREKAALEFSERITRDDREVSNECFGRLRHYFSYPEIVELTFIIGYQTFASKFAKAFQLAPQGFSQRNAEGDNEAG
ncbi:MAG: carboxymuconolactone decarboxylase family protein [Candidatus Methylomirabilales bacterium]